MNTSSLPTLVQQMLRPEFYPHDVEQPIELIQTHISFVFLTGQYAYKIKKAVNLGFLDFSTLEKRRHFCEEELRLNRRISPKLYLEVKAISLSKSGTYSFTSGDHPDAAVEYALQMREFPQEALFSHLFEQGRLKENHLISLADLVAELHTHASAGEEIREFGEPKAIRDVAEKNYDLTKSFIGRVQTQAQFDETKSFTDNFLTQHHDWFQQRQQEGKIRECHGDLHLNNVCVYQDQIQVFDCIEFAPQFRNIDVMYDVAFMVMDLDFRGRSDSGNIFLNRYLEQTGDYQGALLLPFYCSLRATVRAKVQSLILLEDTVPKEEKDAAQECAALYYKLAAAYAQPRQGRLILMSGLSGSGKTTVARRLAPQLSAIHIRSDAVRKQITGIPLTQILRPESYRSGIYGPETTRKTYDRLLELGLQLALHGATVILDAKYDRIAHRSAVIEQSGKHQIPLQILYCTAPLSVIRQRLANRTFDVSDATVDLVEQQQKDAEPFTEAEERYVEIVDTQSQ